VAPPRLCLPGLHFQAQNFARLALGDDLEGAAADFAVGSETLRTGAGVDDKLHALAAERTPHCFGHFHETKLNDCTQVRKTSFPTEQQQPFGRKTCRPKEG